MQTTCISLRITHVLFLLSSSQHWTKLDKSGGGPWPVGRIFHAACCLNYGEEHPQLLVSGGRDKDNNILRDLWVLDVEARTWKEVRGITCMIWVQHGLNT